MIAALFGIFFLLMLVFGTPIAVSMGIASLIVLNVYTNVPALVVPQRLFVMLDSFPLMAVPYFILAGVLMERGGISDRLVAFATALVGRFRGGIGLVTVLSSMIFAGLSGSGAADTAAIGSLMIPALIRKGYPKGYAAALQASAGALGPIIPPSIIMILYASLVNQSPVQMFLGGIIPGVMMGIGLMVMCWSYSVRHGIGGERGADLSEIARAVAGAGWALAMPVLILGGIVFGVFTATEAGIIAVLYALVLGLFIYREIRFTDLPDILIEAARTTTLVMFIVGVAGSFAWILAMGQAPLIIEQLITSLTSNSLVGALLVVVFLLIAGGFVEIAVLIVLFVPVLHPLGPYFRFNELQWAVTLSIALVVGGITPPVCDFLYISTALAGTTLKESSRHIWTFVGWMAAVIVLCLLFPALTIAVPKWIIR